jgi:COMPASS component SWD3
VAGSEDQKAYIWDLQTREVVQVLEGHTDTVVAVAVSTLFHLSLLDIDSTVNWQVHPTQNMIATGSIDNDLCIRIWADRGAGAHPISV